MSSCQNVGNVSRSPKFRRISWLGTLNYFAEFLATPWKFEEIYYLDLWSSTSPLATYLWPPIYYSFTMCFGWVSMSIPGLVSMPTIHRQLGHSLLPVQFLTFTFVFGALCILPTVGWRVPSSLLQEKWTVKISNSKKNGRQPAQDSCA